MAKTWELRKGKVRIIEDAKSASLVIVGRDLKNRTEKIAAIQEVLEQLQSNNR